MPKYRFYINNGVLNDAGEPGNDFLRVVDVDALDLETAQEQFKTAEDGLAKDGTEILGEVHQIVPDRRADW